MRNTNTKLNLLNVPLRALASVDAAQIALETARFRPPLSRRFRTVKIGGRK